MANQIPQEGQGGAAAAVVEPTAADPNLFDDLAAAGVVLREEGDEAPAEEAPAPPIDPPVGDPAPVAPAADPPAGDPPAPATDVAKARKILSAAKRAARQDAQARAKLVEDLRANPGDTLRKLGIAPRDLIAAMNPADAAEPAEPTTEDRVKQLEAKRLEDEKRAAADRDRAAAEEAQRGFEATKLATIEAVKNARVDSAGKQVEAYPRINHTGLHEWVVDLMLAYSEKHSPRDANGEFILDQIVTLPRDKAAAQVEKQLADMGVPAVKVAPPAARPAARPAPATARPQSTVAAPAPVVTARDGGASYEGPAEEIADEDARRTRTFQELGFELN